MILALILAAAATIHIEATIASYAEVETDGDCARLVSNDPDALAWIEDRPLDANADWLCPLDPDPPTVMYATLTRLR